MGNEQKKGLERLKDFGAQIVANLVADAVKVLVGLVLALVFGLGIWGRLSATARQPINLQLWAFLVICLLFIGGVPFVQWLVGHLRREPIPPSTKLFQVHGVYWQKVQFVPGGMRAVARCPICFLRLEVSHIAEDEEEGLCRVIYTCRGEHGDLFIMPPTEEFHYDETDYVATPPGLNEDILDRMEAERLKEAIKL